MEFFQTHIVNYTGIPPNQHAYIVPRLLARFDVYKQVVFRAICPIDLICLHVLVIFRETYFGVENTFAPPCVAKF
jgi:hypothetical protein